METESIDLSMTWGEWGNVYARLAQSGEVAAVEQLRHDLARALAAAQALHAIRGTLSEAQLAVVSATISAELTKQGD